MNKSYRIGAAAVILAVVLRLCCSSLPQKAVQLLRQPEAMRLFLFMQTGRWLELPRTQAGHRAESSVPIFGFSFSQEDAHLVQLQNVCGKDVDIEQLLARPLELHLAGSTPKVLILHTHASESYKNNGAYVEASAYRTLDEQHNMLSVGQAVAHRLEDAGIPVIQDRSLHDYPSYNGSYAHAREAVIRQMEQNPSIQLVLDLHRDAMEDNLGNQVAQVASINGVQAAKIMLVVGGGHEHYEQNLALAIKLHARLEQLYPGICRPIVFRAQVFNQDLSHNMVLVEIGSAGNTQQEALYSAELLAQAIIDLQNGTTESSDH